MKKFIALSILLFTATAIFTGCNSVPKVIPADLSSAQLIQQGQLCYDRTDYSGAIAYYKADIQRYGMDNNIYIEATYEMGHTYIAMKKYKEAYHCFKNILSLYENTYPGQLPTGYNKLSEIGLKQIPSRILAELSADSAE